MTALTLRGVTWDHVRGLGGLVATARAYREMRSDVEVEVEWTTRSLRAFADQPVDELARRFDLLYVDHPAIGYAVARECLVGLDDHLDRAVLDDQVASSVGRSAESYEWEGHRWALATDAAAQVAAYRPDLLERAGVPLPRTWDQVLEAAPALRTAGLWMAFPCIPVDAACAFFAVCAARGEEPFSGEDEVVSRDAGLAALDLLRKVAAASHPFGLEWNPPRMLEHMSTSDDVAYCPAAFGYSNYARPGFRPHVVRFARGPAGTLGGAGLAVSAHTAAVEEALRYAAFVADPDIQRTIYFDGGGQPGHRSAWTDDRINRASSGFFRDTLDAVDGAYLRPRHDGFLEFQEAAGRLVHRHLREGGDPDAALDAMDAAHRDSLAVRTGPEAG